MIEYENIIDLYDDRKKHDLRIFMEGVAKYFENNPRLISNELSIVHSIKSRMKSPEHLRQKILRKFKEGINLNKDNFFSTVTDLAGVRILHLYQKSFGVIDELIRDKIKSEDWVLGEKPKAYCWDPESKEYFEKFELDVHQKPTYYTSVHYLLKPRADSWICCELQVRTLFEEIWGEIDHQINYPTPTDNIACKEQIRVLAKIIGAGSRLLDSLEIAKNNQ